MKKKTAEEWRDDLCMEHIEQLTRNKHPNAIAYTETDLLFTRLVYKFAYALNNPIKGFDEDPNGDPIVWGKPMGVSEDLTRKTLNYKDDNYQYVVMHGWFFKRNLTSDFTQIFWLNNSHHNFLHNCVVIDERTEKTEPNQTSGGNA